MQVASHDRWHVGEDRHDHVVARTADVEIGEISDRSVDVDPTTLGETSGLGDTCLGQIDAVHVEAALGEKHGIAALTFGETEHRTGRQQRDAGAEELIRFGPEEVLVGAIALFPHRAGSRGLVHRRNGIHVATVIRERLGARRRPDI